MANNNRLMDNLRIDLNISPELQRLMNENAVIAPEAFKFGLRAITKEGSKQIKGKIKSLGLVESGALAKSVRGVTTKNKSFIGTKLWYAPFLEDGTKAHRIRPKTARGLHFNRHWARGVLHPATPAHKFFEGTWDQMMSSGQVQSLFAAGVQKAIQEAQNGG